MKKMMILLLFTAFAIIQVGKAQTSLVKLLDLSLISLIEAAEPATYPTKYRVSFKISDIV